MTRWLAEQAACVQLRGQKRVWSAEEVEVVVFRVCGEGRGRMGVVCMRVCVSGVRACVYVLCAANLKVDWNAVILCQMCIMIS